MTTSMERRSPSPPRPDQQPEAGGERYRGRKGCLFGRRRGRAWPQLHLAVRLGLDPKKVLIADAPGSSTQGWPGCLEENKPASRGREPTPERCPRR